jgi:hypothetical protein
MKSLLLALLLLWTPSFAAAPSDVPLREYVDVRFEAMDRAVLAAVSSTKERNDAGLAAQEKAVKLAEENAALWRASANEWRGAMTDREKNFAPRDQLESLQRLVYIGIGGIMVLQFVLMYLKGKDREK